jgi:hypothetical protein
LRGPIRAPDPIGSALLVAGVPEVHQFPDRVVLVGLGQPTTAIPGDFGVAGESQVGTVEVRQLGLQVGLHVKGGLLVLLDGT